MVSRPLLRASALAGALLGAQTALALDPRRTVGEYALDVWRDELPQKTVLSLLQTRDGQLCVGTYEGLALFDGQRFRVIDERTTPALKSRGVRTLAEDATGALWIGTINGGLVRMKDGVFDAFTAEKGLASNAVNVIVCARDGSVWAATEGGVSRLKDGALTTWTRREGLPADVVRGLAEGPDGALWAGTESGLARFESGRFVRVPLATPEPHVEALTVARDGSLWAGTLGSGLYRIRLGETTHFSPESGFAASTVPCVLEDPEGSLWIGTYQGLFRRRGEAFERLDAGQGLPDGSIRSLATDREGSLWVGTNNGLARLKDLKFVNYGPRNGLANENVRVVTEAREGGVWIGTYGGGLALLRHGIVTPLSTREGVTDTFIRSLAEGADGTLWIGTLTRGVLRMKDGRVTELGIRDGLSGATVNVLTVRRDGSLVVGTQPGGLDVLEGSRFVPLLAEASLVRQVRALLEGRDGTLWVGTSDHGVLAVRGREVVASIDAREGLPPSVFALHEDGVGALWIGTSGGLCRWNAGALRCLDTKGGAPDDTVFQILEDRRGGIWVTSNRGLARLSKSEVGAFLDGKTPRVAAALYTKADGLGSTQCNGASQPAGTVLRDGRLAIPTTGGLSLVDPADLHRNATPPPVAVSEVLVDGRPIDRKRTGPLAWQSRRFEFRYAGFSLLVPELVTFRYRIDGLDEDWIEAGSRRAAFYNSIPPGRHVFRVLARNNDGVVSEREAVFPFDVVAPPWKRWWAILGYVLLAAGAVTGGLRVREGVLRHQNRALEESVRQRTGELAEALRRVEASEARAVEANRAKSIFLASMSHELRTPLNAVLGFAQLIERDRTIAGESREGLRIIQRSGEHLLGLINDVLSLSKIESGKLTIEEKPFDLLELLRSVEAIARVRAESKGLEVVLERGTGLPRGVLGDEGKLRQVLINLLGNAVKFTEKGRVVLRAAPAAGRIRFEVADTGPGIAPAELADLFQPFVQTETGRVSREGSGLGLSISREIVRLMGDDLAVESRVGEGSAFRFTIPLPECDLPLAARVRRRVVGLAPGQVPRRILVVDDTLENRILLTSLLKSIGFESQEAVNGAEAVEKWKTFVPDAVFMDMRMPVMDGSEATRRIRALEGTTVRPTLIVALTASVLEHEREAILASGADDFVPKPFRVETILEKLGERLKVSYRYEDEGTASPSAVGLPSALAGIDVASGLVRAGGNPDLYRRLLVEFGVQLEVFVPRLEALLEAGRETEARELLHAVKGSAATLGASAVSVAASAVEAALKQAPGARPDLENLAAAVNEARLACAGMSEPAGRGDESAPPDAATARAARPLLRTLADHLAENNFSATADVASLRRALGSSLAGEMRELEACMDRLDFPKAAALLRQVEAALDEAGGAG